MTIGGSEPNFGGQINGAEQQCTAFNPGNIISSIDGSGGSGGTPTYFWEYSTTSNTGPWTSISSSNSSSYDPPSPLLPKLLGTEEGITDVIHLLLCIQLMWYKKPF